MKETQYHKYIINIEHKNKYFSRPEHSIYTKDNNNNNILFLQLCSRNMYNIKIVTGKYPFNFYVYILIIFIIMNL